MQHTSLLITFALLMSLGVFGVIVPVMPALLYMFFLAVLFGLIEGFVYLTVGNIAILLGIALLSVVVDYTSGILGARFGGARKKSLLYGFIGTILGFIVFPPFGGIAGLFIGIALGELIHRRTSKQAIKAATAGVLGTVSGMAINVLVAISFLVCFIFMAYSI